MSEQQTLDLQSPGLWDLGEQPFPEGWDELSGKPAHRWRLRRDIGGGTDGDDLWFVVEAVESKGSAFLCITPDGSTAGTPDIGTWPSCLAKRGLPVCFPSS